MKRNRTLLGLATLVAALMLVTGMMAGFAARTAASDEEPRPVHIHSGTCDTLGDVVVPLTDITSPVDEGTPMADDGYGESESDDATPMAHAEDEYAGAAESETDVPLALQDIIDGGHAINVHESADQIQNYIACGNILGTPEDGVLEIELAELNDSGYAGEAELVDNGDGTTTVELYLWEIEDASGTPVAATGGTAIEIKNFSFSPTPLEVSVGDTVTWTNNDSAPHTVTQDGGGFQSGKIDPGASFSFTFDTAGDFAYHCEFHANMKGVIVVS